MPLSTAGDGLFNRASEIPQVRRTGGRFTGVRLADRGVSAVRTAGLS
jgi:hypothetical protein